MKKNINIFRTICFLLFIWLIGGPTASAAENIDYREIVTNISTVETESNVISSIFGQGQLAQNDVYVPKQNISGGFVSAQFGFVYLYTKIIFNDETPSEIAQDENFTLSNYVTTEKINTIDEIIFYYAPGGMVTQSFVLKGTDKKIQGNYIDYGRFASTFVENNGVVRTFVPKLFPSPPSEIDGYILVQSDYPTHFVNESTFITYEYEPSITEPSTTEPSITEPSTTEPSTTEPSTTGSDRPLSSFSSNDNDTTKKALPQTGESNNQLFIPMGGLLILGIVIILYYRKEKV